MVLYSDSIPLDTLANSSVIAVLKRNLSHTLKGRKHVLTNTAEMLESVERVYDMVSNHEGFGNIRGPKDLDRYVWMQKAFGDEVKTPEFGRKLKLCRSTIRKALDSRGCRISGIPEDDLNMTREFFKRIGDELNTQMIYLRNKELGYDD